MNIEDSWDEKPERTLTVHWSGSKACNDQLVVVSGLVDESRRSRWGTARGKPLLQPSRKSSMPGALPWAPLLYQTLTTPLSEK
ncbi:hypothetical protein, partial [Pseudomonas trivialis]